MANIFGTANYDTITPWEISPGVSGYPTDDGDYIYGEAGGDFIIGGGGNDFIYGGLGHDTLIGGPGTDYIDGGGNGDDITSDGDGGTYLGGDGYDLMHASAHGPETLDGGRGIDTLDYTNTDYGVDYFLDMRTGLTNNSGQKYTNFENVYLGGGNHTVVGTNGNNKIKGGYGNDILNAKGGDDTVNGGDGNDLITGGLGKDVLNGESGADTFKYLLINDSPNNLSRDIIQNFSHYDGDKIDISSIDANVNVAGNQSFKSAQLIWNPGTHILVANVIGGEDWSVYLNNVQPGFNPLLDLIL
ncbi:MAG: hypothetical protein LM517_06655 [Nitrosomonas sp.]|nr:hypothetical protein [Nitrosomonas sp.]